MLGSKQGREAEQSFKIVEGGQRNKQGQVVIIASLGAGVLTILALINLELAFFAGLGLVAWLLGEIQELHWLGTQRQLPAEFSAGPEVTQAEAKQRINLHGLA